VIDVVLPVWKLLVSVPSETVVVVPVCRLLVSVSSLIEVVLLVS